MNTFFSIRNNSIGFSSALFCKTYSSHEINRDDANNLRQTGWTSFRTKDGTRYFAELPLNSDTRIDTWQYLPRSQRTNPKERYIACLSGSSIFKSLQEMRKPENLRCPVAYRNAQDLVQTLVNRAQVVRKLYALGQKRKSS